MTISIDLHLPGLVELIRETFSGVTTQLNRMEAKLAQIDDEIAQLAQEVQDEGSAVSSAIALINGISQKIADAVAAALAAGATPQQLQAITDANNALKSQTTDLAAAVAAVSTTPTVSGGA